MKNKDHQEPYRDKSLCIVSVLYKMACTVNILTHNVDICNYVEVPAMTNTPLGDWSKYSDLHRYNDSYSHEPSFPTDFENEHSNTAIFGGSFPTPASQVRCFRPQHRAEGHALELDETVK